MFESKAISVFPRRPLAVRAGWRARAALFGGAAMTVAMLAGAAFIVGSEAPGIRQDGRIWSEGRTVAVADVRGRCRNNILLLAQCHLFVTYERSPGQFTKAEASALVFGGLDSPLPDPVVKVDPTDPDCFALNAMVEKTQERWIALAALAGGLLILGAAIGFGVWMSLREERLWRLLARDPQPVAARLLQSRYVSNPNHAREITFEHTGAAGARTARQRLAMLPAKQGTPPSQWRYREPIPLDRAGERLLALAGPRGALLVPADFRPLLLTEAEKAQILSAAAESARG